MLLTLLPAVDVAGGQTVSAQPARSGSGAPQPSPLDAALAWERAGARWIHLVDIDAAFDDGSNAELLAEIVARLHVRVQLAGGVRDEQSLRAAVATGCDRVVLSTSALADLAWCQDALSRHGERIAIGLDVSGGTLSARGAPYVGGELVDVLPVLDAAGCARYVVTDVARDGTLEGPNLDLLRTVCERTDRPVLASGGTASLADLRALAALVPLGVEGVVLGRALYEGTFSFAAALAATSQT